ncbi:MAG: zinc ribbon domain-containing protein [Bryobacteraceae bacterium]
MEQRCTCGALLPDDARFCHKCGKPQYEEDITRLAAEAPATTSPPTPPVAPPPRISFHNSRAVMVSLVVAAVSLLGLCVAAFIAPLLWPVVLCAAGFAAAMLYKGRSPEPLSPAAGARLGWMTGLWLFLVFAVSATLTSIYLASASGREALKALPNIPELAKMLDNPHHFLMSVLASIIPTFFMVTLLPGLGGMLGAKLVTRGRRSS